jgi:ribosomal protein S18 acetylase RimI-like enzyme
MTTRLLSIGVATAEDAAAITAIDPLHRVVDTSTDYFTAKADGELAAFAAVKRDFFGYPFVELLVVADSYRRQGIGLALMDYLCHNCEADRLFTSTNESNTPMQKLLGKAGFTRCGCIDALDENDAELFYVRKK